VTRASGAPRLFARRLSSTEANCRRCFTCKGYPLLDIRSTYSTRDFSSGGVSSWRLAALCSRVGRPCSRCHLVEAGSFGEEAWVPSSSKKRTSLPLEYSSILSAHLVFSSGSVSVLLVTREREGPAKSMSPLSMPTGGRPALTCLVPALCLAARLCTRDDARVSLAPLPRPGLTKCHVRPDVLSCVTAYRAYQQSKQRPRIPSNPLCID